MHQPFTYLIGWPEHNLFYYGVKYAKGCKPSDLWSTYFTSSKYVHEKRKELGEPTLVEVRKVFDNELEARNWETRVLTRIDAHHHPKFLNMTNIRGFPTEKTREHIDKITAKLRGRKLTAEQKKNMKGALGRRWNWTEETKKKMSESAKGKVKSEEHCANISKSMLENPRVQSPEERAKRIESLTGKAKSPDHVSKVIEAKAKARALRIANGTQKPPTSGWKMNPDSVAKSVAAKKANREKRLALLNATNET